MAPPEVDSNKRKYSGIVPRIDFISYGTLVGKGWRREGCCFFDTPIRRHLHLVYGAGVQNRKSAERIIIQPLTGCQEKFSRSLSPLPQPITPGFLHRSPRTTPPDNAYSDFLLFHSGVVFHGGFSFSMRSLTDFSGSLSSAQMTFSPHWCFRGRKRVSTAHFGVAMHRTLMALSEFCFVDLN